MPGKADAQINASVRQIEGMNFFIKRILEIDRKVKNGVF